MQYGFEVTPVTAVDSVEIGQNVSEKQIYKEFPTFSTAPKGH